MNIRLSSTSFLLLLPLLFALVATSCNSNNCNDVVCAPCPSSRFVVQLQDSTGNCISPSTPAGQVYAFNQGNIMDTLYTYNFNDSCTVGFIIEEGLMYQVKAGTDVNQTIMINGFTFQEPVWATECCACYPVDSLEVGVDGSAQSITFPAESYENDPYIITVN